jgi:(p)ppGpp synthase/HD superfamily hydrolase
MKSQLSIAVELAVEAHMHQMYGKLPYIVHLYEVDQLVIQAYADKSRSHGEPYSKEPADELDCLRATAYLHDIIEDTDITFDDLRTAGICEKVVEAVLYITKTDGESYKDYIAGVKSKELARKVKLCDTSANLMNSIKEGNTKRINKYSKQLQLLGGF